MAARVDVTWASYQETQPPDVAWTYQYQAVKTQDCPALDAIDVLKEQADELTVKEVSLIQQIDSFNTLWQSRRWPLDQELEAVRQQKAKVDLELMAAVQRAAEEETHLEPPGPVVLAFVSGVVFTTVCTVVVALNMASMILERQLDSYEGVAEAFNQVFLVCYVVEFVLKISYYQQHLLFGRISRVWWNWLDLIIVITGVLDLWAMPSLALWCGFDLQGAAILEILPLLRALRVLKLLRSFWESDMSWAESHRFEVFMSLVIAANAVVMSLELDIEWLGWPWVENLLLVIYMVELATKIKREGCGLFTSSSNLFWNYVDTLMVLGGLLDLWVMPVIYFIKTLLHMGGETSESQGSFHTVMSLLKLMRIMRILRLVKLVRTVKPLYLLLLGVIQSLKAMQWVLVLTMLMLYAGAIFFVSLVGKGLIYNGHPPHQGVVNFGTVPRALFSLFRLMNGDTDVVASIFTSVTGQLLFVAFMVLSNWAILAILTSVVSDNMIQASQKAAEESQEQERDAEYVKRVTRLMTLFKDIDRNNNGTVSEDEWKSIFSDPGLNHELTSATSLAERELRDLFKCLVVVGDEEEEQGENGNGNMQPTKQGQADPCEERVLHYDKFIEHLRDESRPADKRCVLQIMARMQVLERKLEKQINRRFEELSHSLSSSLSAHILRRL